MFLAAFFTFQSSFVSVSEKGSKNTTMSGDDGTYKITVKSKVSVIILSSVSCANEEVTVGNQREINTELRQSVKVLDDVVIVGYGTKKIKNNYRFSRKNW